jgi:hypothetical protein
MSSIDNSSVTGCVAIKKDESIEDLLSRKLKKALKSLKKVTEKYYFEREVQNKSFNSINDK